MTVLPHIIFPLFSIALDSLGLIVVLILLLSCLDEKLRRQSGSRSFIWLLSFTMLALVANIVGWLGEGHPAYATMTMIANTIATCSSYLVILCFLYYLKKSSFRQHIAIFCIFSALCLICAISIGLWIGNIFFRYAYTVDANGHYVHGTSAIFTFLYLLFPAPALFASLMAAVLSTRLSLSRRIFFIVCALIPVAGMIVDYHVHGLSLTYVAFVICVLMIYTSIYLQKQHMIDAQRNAIMLSQINPHFTHNTLSAIAALCDISPPQAKALTLEFSRYLRHNLTTLSCEDTIPFVQEMNHVDCYLKIEKARFRENLNISYAIHCKDFEVPPLTIQPIVENAVRHGITKKAGGGTVHIATFCIDEYYVIEVRDNGVGFDPDTPPSDGRLHVGMENVRYRVKQMCDGDMQVKSVPGAGTRVLIIIPQKKRQKGDTT